MAEKITLNGTEYASSVQAAKALVADGKTVAEATKILNEAGSTITYQSVYAYTAGNEKTQARRAKYRILSLGKSGRKTASEIAKKTGVTTSKVVSLLKKANIAIVTKEALAKAEAEKKAAKQAEKDAKAAERKAKAEAKKAEKAKAKPEKTKKAEPVVEEPVVEETQEVVDEDQAAMEAAMADMEAEGELD